MDTPNTFQALLASAIRHGLTLGAGFLINKGVIAQDQGPELIGLGMTFVAFGWSWLQKHNTSKVIQDAMGGLNR